ncbi:hypothetical protein Emag_001547 [Eimeria magna]
MAHPEAGQRCAKLCYPIQHTSAVYAARQQEVECLMKNPCLPLERRRMGKSSQASACVRRLMRQQSNANVEQALPFFKQKRNNQLTTGTQLITSPAAARIEWRPPTDYKLADRAPLADRALPVNEAAPAALFGGGFFGGEEAQAPHTHLPHPPHASSDSSMGQVLHNAVLSATTAAGDAAQQAAETARRGLEEARNKAAEWFDGDTRQRAIDAAESARHATAEAATSAAHEAKEGLYALGSMIKEKAPGAADAAYKTAQSASSAAGRAAKELSAAASDAKSAFLTWAGQVREGVQKSSEETLHSASQAAEQAAAAAETARKAALDAAQRATKAAQEARYTLSVFSQHLQSQAAPGSADSAAAAATHHASREAEEAARALEEAARTTKAALASWSDFIHDTLHAGSNQAQDAASKASDAAKDVAERLQHAAVRAGKASSALTGSASLVSAGLETMMTDSSKPILENLWPWMSEKTEETRKSLEDSAKQAADDFRARIPSADEACDCASYVPESVRDRASQAGHYISGVAGRACECAVGNRRSSILEATRRFFGFSKTPESQVEETMHKAARAVQDAASSSSESMGDSLKNAGRRLINSFSRSSNVATAELRPLDGAAWLGSAPTHTSVTDAAKEAADATGISAIKNALPSVYRGQSALDCDPLPPYKDCIAQCDADEANNIASGGSPGLSSSEYSKKRACYLACKAKWIDTALPGCLDTSGNVVPGTAPAALFRSTTTTTTTHPSTGKVGGASSWSDFLKPLQRRDESEEVKDKVKSSSFSWLFGDSATTTTTVPPHARVKGVFNNLFGRDNDTEEDAQWFKGVNWEGWKHPLSGRNASDDKSLREKAVDEARRFAEAAERRIKGEQKPAKFNTILLISAAAVLLFAVIFILVVMRRWETRHREQRVHATERQQIAENTGADIQRPLMQ